MNSADYVLARFLSEERETIDEAVKAAADGVELWVKEGIEKAMNQINAASKEE